MTELSIDRNARILSAAKKLGEDGIAKKIISDCESGVSHYFGFDDCFVVLKINVADDCLCVHIDIAESSKENGFMFGYRFCSERAKEIGAKYITFATKNVKLERLAYKCGWAKLSQGDYGSYWIIEL